jgi:hypothetical protein
VTEFLPPKHLTTVFGICSTYLAIESDKITAAWFSVIDKDVHVRRGLKAGRLAEMKGLMVAGSRAGGSGVGHPEGAKGAATNECCYGSELGCGVCEDGPV